MKGQSAIEYLMTYGWMLLVVAIVGGLVFNIVQDQNIEEVTGFGGEEMMVENFGVNSQNQLTLQVLNARSGEVEVTNVTVEGQDGIKYNDSFPTGEDSNYMLFGSQDSRQIIVEDFNNTNSGESFDVKIIFDRGGLTDQISQGRITGTLSMLNTN